MTTTLWTDLDEPLGKYSYNIVVDACMFEKLGGQEEGILGYWQDDVDFCRVLQSNGVEVKVCPRRHAGYHIPHPSGTRAGIVKGSSTQYDRRIERFKAGEKLVSNEGRDWGRAKLLNVNDYTG